MEKNKFDQNIIAHSNGKLAKTRNPKSILLGMALLIIGIALILKAPMMGMSGSPMNTFCWSAGISLIAIGIIMLFWVGKALKYVPTGSRVKEKLIHLDTYDLPYLVSIVESADFEALEKIKKLEKSGTKMDVFMSEDSQFAAIQFFRYIPHHYEAASDIHYFHGNDAVKFANTFTFFE